MSIRIEIVIPDHVRPADYLDHTMQALGFTRNGTIPAVVDCTTKMPIDISGPKPTKECEPLFAEQEISDAGAPASATTTLGQAPTSAGAIVTRVLGALVRNQIAMDGDRERGKAGPGHRRRTNEQIKSDDEYFAAHSQPAPLAPGAAEALISTGEERISPEDAADEAAETATRAGDKPTIEDLRAAVGRYTEKFGAKASIDSIRTIIGCPIIEVKEDGVAAAIGRVEIAIAGGEPLYGAPKALEEAPNEPVDLPTEPAHTTKADVIEAFAAYGKKYDGVSDPKLMALTREDLPKVLENTFGAGATTIGKIPQTPEGFGKAMTAVYEAVRDNPFKRSVHQ
jgi:hypothetical protein